jgi:hypothetical protein
MGDGPILGERIVKVSIDLANKAERLQQILAPMAGPSKVNKLIEDQDGAALAHACLEMARKIMVEVEHAQALKLAFKIEGTQHLLLQYFEL